MTDHDLTPELQQAFDALPREEPTSDLLEERTVRALRAEGLLVRRDRRGILMTPALLAAAASVIVVLMLGLFALGQWTGSRQGAGPAPAVLRQENERLIALVQEAEAAHVRALSKLVHVSATASPAVRTRNRRVALRSFYAVADQMVSLAPDDPLTARIMQAFDQGSQGPLQGDESGRSQIVWF